jgi:archaellum component FlaC
MLGCRKPKWKFRLISLLQGGEMGSFQAVPNDVIKLIIHNLDVTDLPKMAATSKRLHECVTDYLRIEGVATQRTNEIKHAAEDLAGQVPVLKGRVAQAEERLNGLKGKKYDPQGLASAAKKIEEAAVSARGKIKTFQASIEALISAAAKVRSELGKFKGSDLKERIKTIEETVAKLKAISHDLVSSIELSKTIQEQTIAIRKSAGH